MGFKSMTNKVTSKVGKQVLTVQKHSPVLLFGVGIIGVTTTAVLACRATLKMTEVLDKGEKKIEEAGNESFVIDNSTSKEEIREIVEKSKFNAKLIVAIDIAKLYAPAVIVGVLSVGALTGSHVILKRRNAGLAAAYAIVDKSFKEYRGRVVADQGAEKDLEYRFGVNEREIVEEGPNGPETRTIKGLDQNEIKKNAHLTYSRVFDEYNNNWSDIPVQNPAFVQQIQNWANDLLRVKGWVTLNDVYDMLGFEKTVAGQMVGWVYEPKLDADGNRLNDSYIQFGVWKNGVYNAKEWINGNEQAILLDFNVDGDILYALAKV
jgi:hypothetical protein